MCDILTNEHMALCNWQKRISFCSEKSAQILCIVHSKCIQNMHSVCGKPTLEDVEHFWNGSVHEALGCLSTSKHSWVNLSSRNIKRQREKHKCKSCCVYRCDCELGRIPIQSSKSSRNQRRNFSTFVYTPILSCVFMSSTF